MSEAPEKIWLPRVHAEDAANMPDNYGELLSYTRSDIADTLRAEVARLNAEASVLEAWLAGVARKPPHTGREKVSVQAHGEADQ
jgi:hypothetical protein